VYPALIIASKLCAVIETAAMLENPFVKQGMSSEGCVGFGSGGNRVGLLASLVSEKGWYIPLVHFDDADFKIECFGRNLYFKKNLDSPVEIGLWQHFKYSMLKLES
jgi:hypothetical protein